MTKVIDLILYWWNEPLPFDVDSNGDLVVVMFIVILVSVIIHLLISSWRDCE